MGSRVVVEHDRGKVIFPVYRPCIYTSHLPVYLFYRHLEGYRPEKMVYAEDSPSSASRHRLCRLSISICGAPANTDPCPV